MENRKYFKEVDLYRGILIILVVIGHIALQTNVPTSQLKNIYTTIGNVIYSFHMPAFFFISGFCSYKMVRLGINSTDNIYILRLPTP